MPSFPHAPFLAPALFLRCASDSFSLTKAVRYLDQISAWPVIVLDYRAMRDAIEAEGGEVSENVDAAVSSCASNAA